MNMDTFTKHVLVLAGPAGSGKDTIAQELMRRYDTVVPLVTATTRVMRGGEEDGVNYYYMDNTQFKQEIEKGNILEYYHRSDTDTYYGTYKPDLDKKLASGKIVIAIIQIVGAKYLKKHYNACTVFIMPPSLDAFEQRIRERSPMTDSEWQERKKFTQEEIRNESGWYDYRIQNDDGKLNKAVDDLVDIMRNEGYIL